MFVQDGLAAEFLTRWGSEMEPLYEDQMRHIRSLTSKEFLDQDPYFRSLNVSPQYQQEAKFRCDLSFSTWDLVHSYLWGSDSLLLLDILNTHVTIGLQDRLPKSALQVQPTVVCWV